VHRAHDVYCGTKQPRHAVEESKMPHGASNSHRRFTSHRSSHHSAGPPNVSTHRSLWQSKSAGHLLPRQSHTNFVVTTGARSLLTDALKCQAEVLPSKHCTNIHLLAANTHHGHPLSPNLQLGLHPLHRKAQIHHGKSLASTQPPLCVTDRRQAKHRNT
jgi:hypothetical protein